MCGLFPGLGLSPQQTRDSLRSGTDPIHPGLPLLSIGSDIRRYGDYLHIVFSRTDQTWKSGNGGGDACLIMATTITLAMGNRKKYFRAYDEPQLQPLPYILNHFYIIIPNSM